MTRRTLLAIIILLAILGIVLWAQNRQSKKQEAVSPILSVSASKSSANPGDTIVYTLNVENPSDKVIEAYTVEANIADISQLANLIDASGASFNPATGSLIWTPVDIPSQGLVQKQFTVKVKDQLSAADQVLSLRFNNELKVVVSKPGTSLSVPGKPGTDMGSGKPQVAGKEAPASGAGIGFVYLLSLLSTLGLLAFKRLTLS